MTRRRRWRGVIAGLAALAVLAGCGSEAPPPPPSPMRILLVNDDGWSAPGIVALRDALRRAGHAVIEVAPATDRSNSGTGATYTGELSVFAPTGVGDIWAVRGGTAADATLVGLRAVMAAEPPDLVVAGVDTRHNVSLSALQSGTVGAASAAVSVGFPAVAVSTDVADPARPQPAEFDPTVAFTTRLVDRLSQRAPDVPILPRGTLLNVNYPGGGATARGVAAVPTSEVAPLALSYRHGRGPTSFIPVTTPNPPSGREDDRAALAEGQATVSDLSADPDRSAPPPRAAARLVGDLTP